MGTGSGALLWLVLFCFPRSLLLTRFQAEFDAHPEPGQASAAALSDESPSRRRRSREQRVAASYSLHESSTDPGDDDGEGGEARAAAVRDDSPGELTILGRDRQPLQPPPVADDSGSSRANALGMVSRLPPSCKRIRCKQRRERERGKKEKKAVERDKPRKRHRET